MRRALTAIAVLLALAVLAPAATAATGSIATGEIVLELQRDRAPLAAALQAVSDPASPQYGRFVTFAQAVSLNGVDPATQRVAVRWLRPRVQRVRVDPTGLFVHVWVTAEQAKSVFRVKALVMGKVVIAGGLPRIPRALARVVTHASGLVFVADARNPGVSSSADRRIPVSSSPRRTGTPSGCARGLRAGGFTPNQIRTAYGFPEDGGRGRHVVLFESGQNFSRSEVRAYARCFGLHMPQLRKIRVGDGPDPRRNLDGEVLLDIEGVMGLLPRLSKLDVMIGTSSTPFPSILAAAITPWRTGMKPPDAVSVSYGVCEVAMARGGTAMYGSVPLWEDLTAMAGLLGTTVVVSSGDSGSTGCLRQQQLSGSLSSAMTTSVAYPSNGRFATAVGGTGMRLSKANIIAGQRPWNTRVYGGHAYEIVALKWTQWGPKGPISITPGQGSATQLLGAGGGGRSTMVAAPWYQSEQRTSQRLVPDVSMFADEKPGVTIRAAGLFEGGWGPVGGTSYAAPVVASAAAAVNARLEAAGGHRLGFLNPLLYAAGSAPVAQQPFNDIPGGSNDLAYVGCCTAFPGYDLATGWGTINVRRLGAWAEAHQ